MSIRIDSDVKAKAQALFSALGIDMTTAINIFLRQAIQHQGIPFNEDAPFILAAIGNTSSSRSAAQQHGSPDMYSGFHVF